VRGKKRLGALEQRRARALAPERRVHAKSRYKTSIFKQAVFSIGMRSTRARINPMGGPEGFSS
jgi:hypothetical protein